MPPRGRLYSTRLLLSLLQGLLAPTLLSGCAATSWVVETATRGGKPRFDDIATVERAWVGDDRLVISFTGWLERSPKLRDAYSPPIYGEAEPWWFDAELGAFREFAAQPRPPRVGAAQWPPLRQGVEVAREALRRGEPPDDFVAGMKEIPVVDLRELLGRRREAYLRDDVARRERALYHYLGSEDLNWRGNVAATLHYVEREPATGRPDLLRVELEPLVPPPKPAAWALLPVAIAVDVALLPVYLAMELLGANVAVLGFASL